MWALGQIGDDIPIKEEKVLLGYHRKTTSNPNGHIGIGLDLDRHANGYFTEDSRKT